MSAKITRPLINLARIVQRQRLFSLLDAKTKRPVLWITAPAGSGKTTLVASYLDARELPGLWYQCDEGDGDLSTFFYYMGLAAKKAAPQDKHPLPLLTAEYLGGTSTFTRRYFEQLYGRLITRLGSRSKPSGKGDKGGFFIVLDNYQDVPAGSPFHDMIATGFDIIPEGVLVVVISRNYPPSPLVRLQANDKISLLEYHDVRFTLEESAELVRGRMPRLDNRAIQDMFDHTEGWAAGIILILARTRLEGQGADAFADVAYEDVFDYFAGEIFDRTEREIQDFLLKTAFLPILSVPLAEKLTGVGNAGRILAALNSHNFFTERLSGGGHDYQYHPLFRRFLLNRVKSRLAPEELAVICTEAASLLSEYGRIEEAARLYGDAGDGDGLARLIMDHARTLLMQGRNKTLAEWIAGIPVEMAAGHPWLWYWQGMSSFPYDIPRARQYLEKAFDVFMTAGDASGIYLSWAGIVDTFAFDFDEWKRLDDCIAIFEDLRRTWSSFPSQEIELIASSRMLISLTLRKADQTERVERWQERVSDLLLENPSFDIQMDTVFYMTLYFLWKGQYNRNAVLLEKAESDIRCHKPSPFVVIRLKMMQGIHYWITGRYAVALNALSEGLDISKQSGVHVFDSLLWSFRAAAEMAPGNLDGAERSLRNQMASLRNTNKTLDTFFCHINFAWYAILKGNPSLAAGHMETISTQVAKIGTPYYRALWHIGMAQVAYVQERAKDARSHIHTAHQISLDMKSQVMEWYSVLIGAYILLNEGRDKEGMGSLRRGLMLGKRHGYVHLEFYQPAVMQFLCARALAAGIEREYVQGLIRKLALLPPVYTGSAAAVDYPEDWPYPVKIHTLGRFEVIKDDKPLSFSGKVQKKPLEMLKAVIALGGMNVSVDRLSDVLWPDVEGDLAHKSFEMTLSRLRRLLGGEKYIKCRAGQLSLDPLSCRVDSLDLEQFLEIIRKSPAHKVVELCEKAVNLYKGPFLPTDTDLHCTVARREILKTSLFRIVIIAGRHCEQAGQWGRAAEYYLKGLDTDDLAEEFYQHLMVCYYKLGNISAAAKTYNRCRHQLREHLGIGPSPETEAVYSSIIQKP